MVPKPITLKTLLIAIAVAVGVEFVARIMIAQGIVNPMIGLGLARLFQIILLLLTVITLEKDFASIGIDSSQLTAGVRAGIIWSLAFGFAAGIVFLILWAAGLQVSVLFKSPIPLTHDDIFLFIAVGALIAPIAEEIFFRGILYGFFRQWSLTMALVISTALFILSHAPNSGLPITQMIGGLLFAVAYEIKKNLLVPIIIHSLGNMAIFCLSYLIQS